MPIEGKLLHEALSKEIIGAAMTVLNTLGPGLNEKVYENALVLEMLERGLTIHQQQEFPVYYKGHFVGKLVPDVIVNELILVDTKVVEHFCDADTAQVLSYLAIAQLELGMLINFQRPTLEWKRLIRKLTPLPPNLPFIS